VQEGEPASLGKSEWRPFSAGNFFAVVFKKLAARIAKGQNAERRFMNHCLKWLKHSGSLEYMTLDLLNLTPDQASEEVDPELEVLRARMMSQGHDTLQQEVLQEVTTGTQFVMKAEKEKVRQRGGVLPSAKGKEHQVFSEVWKLAGK